MPLQRWTRLVAAAGFSLAVLGSFTPAKAEQKPAGGDPRVERIVKAALQHVTAAKSIAFEARIVNEVPRDSGQKVQKISTFKSYIRRPDRLACCLASPCAERAGARMKPWNRRRTWT